MKLYQYWRSGTSYRTRIAMALKGLNYESVGVDLREAKHKTPEFLALNPQGLVPALILEDGTCLSQSVAIIEYLEETHPTPALLPTSAKDRAIIRAMAAIIGCDIHPLNNLRMLRYQRDVYGADDEAISKWAATWTNAGFAALEKQIELHNPDGVFAHGDAPGLVECYLIPQIYSALRFNIDLTPYSRLISIDAACNSIKAFQDAHPDQQADAD